MVVFLSETRFFSDRVDGLLRSLGFAHGLGVRCQGRGGGLSLLCRDEVDVKLQSLDRLHIDVVILDPMTTVERWRLTGFYGESRRELRHRNWDYLKELNYRSSLPWLCVGGF
jgi:hypothetical protein